MFAQMKGAGRKILWFIVTDMDAMSRFIKHAMVLFKSPLAPGFVENVNLRREQRG